MIQSSMRCLSGVPRTCTIAFGLVHASIVSDEKIFTARVFYSRKGTQYNDSMLIYFENGISLYVSLKV